jgi:predicted phage tail protein
MTTATVEVTPQLRTIKLHGFLAKKYAKSVELAADNMFQVMCGLISRFGPQFKEDIRAHNWHICEDKVKPGNDLSQDELEKTLTKKTLHFVPEVKGSSAALKIVIGIILLVAAFFGYGNQYTVQTGIMLILGGVSEILTRPKLQGPVQAQDQRGSSIYNGALNVTTQGGPVPLIYGRVQRASSVVISTDFSSDEA